MKAAFAMLYDHDIMTSWPGKQTKKNKRKQFKKQNKTKRKENKTSEEQHDATGGAAKFGVTVIKKNKTERDKAIDHMTSDPLTVGFLHSALHFKKKLIKRLNEKLSRRMQKYRFADQKEKKKKKKRFFIYTRSCQIGEREKREKTRERAEAEWQFVRVEKRSCSLTLEGSSRPHSAHWGQTAAFWEKVETREPFRGFTAMPQPCFPSGSKSRYWQSDLPQTEMDENVAIIYPVFKVGEVASSSASSEASSEARGRGGAAGATEGASEGAAEGASAGGAASPPPRRHEAPPTAETSSSSIVSQRDAEGLRIHAPLLRPGRPAVPGATVWTPLETLAEAATRQPGGGSQYCSDCGRMDVFFLTGKTSRPDKDLKLTGKILSRQIYFKDTRKTLLVRQWHRCDVMTIGLLNV